MSRDWTTVRTGSRLHFGLLHVPSPTELGNRGPGERTFGGVGLMIQDPALVVRVRPAASWSATGPEAERALDAAKRVVAAMPTPSSRDVCVERCPPPHSGLGTGTQLALAAGLAALPSGPAGEWNTDALAKAVGRGLRSGIGVHGFATGGFLVDGGKSPQAALAPLICRREAPASWQVLLILPGRDMGLSGDAERRAFAQLAGDEDGLRQTEVLCRLVLLGLVPALIEADLDAFGEALYEYNHRAGLLFKKVQGGPYRSPRTAALIKALRHQGVRGVGQSSWGPTIFAIAERDRLEHAAARLSLVDGESVLITSPRNEGASRELPKSV